MIELGQLMRRKARKRSVICPCGTVRGVFPHFLLFIFDHVFVSFFSFCLLLNTCRGFSIQFCYFRSFISGILAIYVCRCIPTQIVPQQVDFRLKMNPFICVIVLFALFKKMWLMPVEGVRICLKQSVWKNIWSSN